MKAKDSSQYVAYDIDGKAAKPLNPPFSKNGDSKQRIRFRGHRAEVAGLLG